MIRCLEVLCLADNENLPYTCHHLVEHRNKIEQLQIAHHWSTHTQRPKSIYPIDKK